MARPVWVIGVFAAGIAVGFFVARLTGQPDPETGPAPVAASGAASPVTATPAAAIQPAGASTPPPPVRVASATAPSSVVSESGVNVPDAEYTGYSQPIDTGPVFQKVMAQKPPPGAENRLGDLHRTLERELRDDSWAYPMEAELQNSLVAETSAGKLTVEHLECRATLCELRLSGTSANEQALTDWSASVGKQPWASRLYMNLSSSVSDGERVDSLLIFRRPTK